MFTCCLHTNSIPCSVEDTNVLHEYDLFLHSYRIKDATSSCIKIWVTTVGDAYCKYLGETLAALVKQLDTVEEKMKG